MPKFRMLSLCAALGIALLSPAAMPAAEASAPTYALTYTTDTRQVMNPMVTKATKATLGAGDRSGAKMVGARAGCGTPKPKTAPKPAPKPEPVAPSQPAPEND